MANRGISRNPGYRAGSHWAVCDSCGFQFRAEELRQTWDNRWVCRDDWEPRHPQDFLRVKPEKISVDQPIRPEQLGDACLETPANDSVVDYALVEYAIVDKDITNLCFFDTNARSAIAGWASAGEAIVGILNAEENLAEIIPKGTFNPNTL